jgi:hypothetical protein
MFDNLQKFFSEMSELINRYNEQRMSISQLQQENAELKAQLSPEEEERSRP